jgi:subtilisin family serine protease
MDGEGGEIPMVPTATTSDSAAKLVVTTTMIILIKPPLVPWQVVVNLSLGTSGTATLIDTAVTNAAALGNIIFVAAAGNSNVE